MPRGNPNIWKHYGASYEQISTQPGTTSNAIPAPSSLPAAGSPSTLGTRRTVAAGENTWSLGTTGRDGQLLSTRLQQTTENRMQYKPPPEDYKRRGALRTDKSDFPRPDYPTEYKTVTQIDFGQDLMKRPDYQRSAPVKATNTAKLLPVDCDPPLFTTQAQLDYVGGGGVAGAAAKSQRHAGHPATQRAGYNPITGGHPLTNNAFEQWDGRDYRRHR